MTIVMLKAVIPQIECSLNYQHVLEWLLGVDPEQHQCILDINSQFKYPQYGMILKQF
jgi:hypothetical protein